MLRRILAESVLSTITSSYFLFGLRNPPCPIRHHPTVLLTPQDRQAHRLLLQPPWVPRAEWVVVSHVFLQHFGSLSGSALARDMETVSGRLRESWEEKVSYSALYFDTPSPIHAQYGSWNLRGNHYGMAEWIVLSYLGSPKTDPIWGCR